MFPLNRRVYSEQRSEKGFLLYISITSIVYQVFRGLKCTYLKKPLEKFVKSDYYRRAYQNGMFILSAIR